MADDITQNPDYRLVMAFLKNINPGDMDQESSEQLRMIGQRIKAGGALTDREREMFEAIVGAMPQMPMDPNMGAMSEGEMNLPIARPIAEGEMNVAMPSNMTEAEMVQAEEDAYFERLRLEQEQMYNMNQEAMRQQTQSPVPMTSPRPQMRPSAPMTSPRPQMRPTR
tara:strand:+ start:567 stop:1067 length:501 start_codon:yes stop_codon:yes gene_type:complete